MVTAQQIFVLENIIEASSENAETLEGMWIIVYKGNQIELESKKRYWHKLSHAKAALSDKIKDTFHSYLKKVDGVEYKETDNVYSATIAQMEATGVLEFRNVK